MDLDRRMRCSMSRSDMPCQSLATSRAVGYSLAHGNPIRMLQPSFGSCHRGMHDCRSLGLREDSEKTGVAEAGGWRRAIRAAGAGSQAGVAGRLL